MHFVKRQAISHRVSTGIVYFYIIQGYVSTNRKRGIKIQKRITLTVFYSKLYIFRCEEARNVSIRYNIFVFQSAKDTCDVICFNRLLLEKWEIK